MGGLRFLFSLDGRVSRLQFFTAGVALTALKFSVEAAWAYLVRGVTLSPLRYFHPAVQARYGEALNGDWGLLLTWSLPFLWVGFALTVRRVADADWPGHVPVYFFIPGLNLLLFVLLCLIRTSKAPSGNRLGEAPPRDRSSIRDAAVAALVAFLIALPMAVTPALMEYGAALFIGTPFVAGLVAGGLWNRAKTRSPGSTISVALAAVLMVAGALLVFAIEGAICLAMAAPLGMALAAMGSMAGRALARSGAIRARALGALALPLPLMLAVDARPKPTSFRDVESVIEIDAPAERVFPLVASFPPIAAPPELPFRAGIARPMAATIDGHGVGAIRQCHFTTGPFIEPITVWEPPYRLSFGVTGQPRAMSELTPYETIWAPHLDGEMLRVSEGAFQLVRLPGSRTRVIGRTRYTLDMRPGWYWAMWGDEIIHRIHLRVLNHIKLLAESDSARGNG